MDIPPPKPKQNLGRKRGVKQEQRNFSVATKAKQAAKRTIKAQDLKIRKAHDAIQNAKKALRLKQLRKTCDNIRQASLKILLEISEWRLCMKKLEEDTFYEMNVNADSMANQQHNHTVAGSNIPRSSNNTIADFFQIGMPITPLTPNTLDFSNIVRN